MWTLCCFLLTLLAASHQLNIDEFVVPASAEAGSDVELKCGFSLDANDRAEMPYVKWWFTALYSSEEKPLLLYQRISNTDGKPFLHTNVIASVGRDDIILKDVKYTDSGRYVCEVSGFKEKRVHADLVVFSNGTGPDLNISVIDDGPDSDLEPDLLLECHADDVTPRPELVISLNGRPVEGVCQYETSDGEGLYNVSANVTVSNADLEDAEVRCELFFENHHIAHLPFVDVETYNPSGAAVAASGTAPPPANMTLLNNGTESQINQRINDVDEYSNVIQKNKKLKKAKRLSPVALSFEKYSTESKGSPSRSVNWWLSVAAFLVMVLHSSI